MKVLCDQIHDMKIYLITPLFFLLSKFAYCTIHFISVSDNVYSPSLISTIAGDTIKFQWISGNHPTISDDGSFNDFSMNILSQTYSLVIYDTGIYPYHCLFHGSAGGEGMSGTIVVNDAPLTCNYPNTIMVGNVTSSSVIISWMAQSNAAKYKINYRPLNTSPWLVKSTTTNSKMINNLIPNTTYEYKIKSVCNTKSSTFSAKDTFTTSKQKNTSHQQIQSDYKIFSDPCRSTITISNSLLTNESISIEVLDLKGQLIHASQHISSDPVRIIELPDETTGVILLRITQQHHVVTKKLLLVCQ